MAYDDIDWGRRTLGPTSYGSVLERRSLIWNDNWVVAPVAPPLNITGTAYYGKFFTRGCRGKIDALSIYCIRTAAGTLDLSFSPHPCLGPLYTVTVTPGAAWAWVVATFYQMWNYDALFVWVSRCDADVSYGFDSVIPYDSHRSTDVGATWTSGNWRLYIRAHMFGETPGDVPVSGIINNIPIPNTSSRLLVENQAIEVMVPLEIIRIDGAGYVDLVVARVNAAANSDHTYVQVECDGNISMDMTFVFLNLYGFNDDTQPLSIPQYAEDGACTMMITKKFEFRRLFRVLCLNNLGAQIVHVHVYPNLMR